VMNYLVSVPWRKVKVNEVLLAWEMNGEPLPKIHGFPLRAVVYGCKSHLSLHLTRKLVD
jgi:sulfite oxidase